MASTYAQSIFLLNLLTSNFQSPGRITMVASGAFVTPPAKGVTNSAVDEALRNAWTAYGPGSHNSSKLRRTTRSTNEGATLLSPYFQPMTSEWDSLISEEKKPPEVVMPNFLNHLLAASIVFQVNNHEEVAVLEKIGLGVLIGTFLSTWVLLGIGISVIPIKWILSKKDIHELISLEEFELVQRNQKLTDIEHRVKSALSEGWLRNLR